MNGEDRGLVGCKVLEVLVRLALVEEGCACILSFLTSLQALIRNPRSNFSPGPNFEFKAPANSTQVFNGTPIFGVKSRAGLTFVRFRWCKINEYFFWERVTKKM